MASTPWFASAYSRVCRDDSSLLACILLNQPAFLRHSYYLVGMTFWIYLPRVLAGLLCQKTVPAPAYQCLVAKISGLFCWYGVASRLDVVRINDSDRHCSITGFTRGSSQYRRIIPIDSFWQTHVYAHTATH